MRGRISLNKGLVPLLISFLIIILCLTGCAENSSILDNGQSRQLEFSVSTHGWNNFNNSSDSKPNSRATPISGNTFDASKSFNVIADVNKDGNRSTEVNNETVSYSTANNIWQTSATHYWPGSGSTVNFYAYYPIGVSSSINHTSGSVPTLSYTVPDNAADQIDILASSKTGVAGDSYNQTPVDFKHIFAAVQFSVGSNGMPNGTITNVTLNNIQYKGAYSLDGTWTPNTTDKKCFSQTVSASTSTGTAITSGTTTFIMMPQTLSSDASITITYSNGGTLTKAITGTWEAGKTYTYNLSKTIPVANFDYTGNVQSYTVPLTGTYKIECWGASGGDTSFASGGKGAYTSGNIKLFYGATLFVYVGQQGQKTSSESISGGGWNGGGNGNTMGHSADGRSGGGGATDIRITQGNWDNPESLRSRIMVAGAGGGNSQSSLYTGDAGGLAGYTSSLLTAGKGGTQNAGGTGGSGSYGNAISGGFGYGGSGDNYASGGGSGYYGGGGGARDNVGYDGNGGGGSSYISGYDGCTTYSNIYIFSDTRILDGKNSIISPVGITETGHTGNGYARITFVSAN